MVWAKQSSILTSLKHKQDLEKLFAPTELPTLTLLCSGARDGFTTDAFHARCDNKGATLTVVRSECDVTMDMEWTEGTDGSREEDQRKGCGCVVGQRLK